jgi:hypothetical protein
VILSGLSRVDVICTTLQGGGLYCGRFDWLFHIGRVRYVLPVKKYAVCGKSNSKSEGYKKNVAFFTDLF